MAVYQGTYYAKSFLLKHSDGTAYDVSGWTFQCQLRDRVDTVSLLELTTANGGFVVVDGPTGEVSLRITAVQSALLPVARLVFDVLRTNASPGPVWQFGGKLSVRRPVTR